MKKLLNKIDIPLRWVDMDAYQHVNNSRYFDYMTESRAQLLKEFKTTNMHYFFVVVDAQCNFKKSYIYPDTVIVEQYLEALGNASFVLNYLFKSKNDPNTVYAKGMTKMVCYDPTTKKAAKLPDAVLKLLQA